MKFIPLLLSLIIPSAFAVGVINPNVTQYNLSTTVCAVGWTKSIRPTTYRTNYIKAQKLKEAGISKTEIKQYELDHIIPLSSGGHPSDNSNLALQLWNSPLGAKAKDKLELQVNHKLCSNKITLKEAQLCFFNDWTTCKL